MENGTESYPLEYQCEHSTYRRIFVPYHSGTALEILHGWKKTPTNYSVNKKTNHTYLSQGDIIHTNLQFFFPSMFKTTDPLNLCLVKKSSIIRTWQWKLLRIREMFRDHHSAVRPSSVISGAKVKPWIGTFFIILREKTILRVI